MLSLGAVFDAVPPRSARRTVKILLRRFTPVRSCSTRAVAPRLSKRNKERRLITLETTDRLVEQASKYKELLSLECFDGYITPDLPLVTSLSDVFKSRASRLLICFYILCFFRLGAKINRPQASTVQPNLHDVVRPSALKIKTIAAQVMLEGGSLQQCLELEGAKSTTAQCNDYTTRKWV